MWNGNIFPPSFSWAQNLVIVLISSVASGFSYLLAQWLGTKFFMQAWNDNSFVRMYYCNNFPQSTKTFQMVIPTEPNKARANETGCAWLHPERANETGCAWLHPERANEIGCAWLHPERADYELSKPHSHQRHTTPWTSPDCPPSSAAG